MYNYLQQRIDSEEHKKKIDVYKNKARSKRKIREFVEKIAKTGNGAKVRFKGNYSTLKVIPKSKRTKENCNSSGVALSK